MRGCLTTLVLIALLAVGADYAATRYVEGRIAGELASEMEADSVTVDLEGWPVAVRLLTGGVPTAQMKATGVPLQGGATLDTLDVVLTDVDVNVADLREEAGRLPRAQEGTFEATLSEESVVKLLGLPAGLVDVRLRGGNLRLSAAGLSLDAEVVAGGGDVVVQLKGPLAELLGGAAFPIDISSAPGEPFVTDVDIAGGIMTVSGKLEDVRRPVRQ